MNILFFMSDDSCGVAYHRLHLPSRYIKAHEVRRRVTRIYEEDLKWADVLIISRVMDGIADEVKEKCIKYKVKLVVDVDDLWILPTNHILHTYYQKTGYGKKQEDYLRAADQVWTTNIRLAEEIKPFNKNVKIIPNALPFGEDQFTDERTPSDRVRFFYAGGHTHKHDISLLSDVCREMRKDEVFKEKGQFVLAGGFDGIKDVYVHGIWEKMERDYSGHAIGKPTYKRLYGKGCGNYMELYREADVGLVPLEDNRFTRCKSNLKLLECAAKKIPVICSNVATYTDNDPPVMFTPGIDNREGGSDWYFWIKTMIQDGFGKSTMGNRLYEWAQEHHNLHNTNKLREAAVNEL